MEIGGEGIALGELQETVVDDWTSTGSGRKADGGG